MYLHTHVPTHKKTFCETAFLAALFIIAKYPKQPNRLPKGEWRNKLIYLYNTELLRKKKSKLLMWMDLKIILLNEKYQTEKNMILFI